MTARVLSTCERATTLYAHTPAHVLKRENRSTYLKLDGAEFFDVQSYNCAGRDIQRLRCGSYVSIRVLPLRELFEGIRHPFTDVHFCEGIGRNIAGDGGGGGGGGQTHLSLALVIKPLTMHPFRDRARFFLTLNRDTWAGTRGMTLWVGKKIKVRRNHLHEQKQCRSFCTSPQATTIRSSNTRPSSRQAHHLRPARVRKRKKSNAPSALSRCTAKLLVSFCRPCRPPIQGLAHAVNVHYCFQGCRCSSSSAGSVDATDDR